MSVPSKLNLSVRNYVSLQVPFFLIDNVLVSTLATKSRSSAYTVSIRLCHFFNAIAAKLFKQCGIYEGIKIEKLTPSIQIANEKREIEYTLDFEEAVNKYEFFILLRSIALILYSLVFALALK